MLNHIFDESDHLALQNAAQLVNEVIERNRSGLTMPALTLLCAVLNEMRLAELMMDVPKARTSK